jgi:hypothetical protein
MPNGPSRTGVEARRNDETGIMMNSRRLLSRSFKHSGFLRHSSFVIRASSFETDSATSLVDALTDFPHGQD